MPPTEGAQVSNFAPKRPCKSPGCSALVAHGEGTYCPAHASTSTSRLNRRAFDAYRGSAASRGYDARWQQARLAFLARHPLCPGVLLPTEHWTIELAIEFHHYREQQREKGTLLVFGHGEHGAKPWSSPSHSSVPSGSASLTSVSQFLDRYPVYRIEPWDVARPATVVDHIVPHRGDPLLMWSEWNWQPITKRAHDRKTATEKAAPCPIPSVVL